MRNASAMPTALGYAVPAMHIPPEHADRNNAPRDRAGCEAPLDKGVEPVLFIDARRAAAGTWDGERAARGSRVAPLSRRTRQFAGNGRRLFAGQTQRARRGHGRPRAVVSSRSRVTLVSRPCESGRGIPSTTCPIRAQLPESHAMRRKRRSRRMPRVRAGDPGACKQATFAAIVSSR